MAAALGHHDGMSDTEKPTGAPPVTAEDITGRLYAFGDLEEGWDGETAEPASWPSIRDATRLVRAAGDLALCLEPTLHADGTAILEAESGTLGFPGDGTVTYAFEGVDPGRADFDGALLPPVIRDLLRKASEAA